ncbi:pyruvate kinase [candidate division KSB1 bacterium]|nr:pyruvate kinase [candidate division KSB1 bacterium]
MKTEILATIGPASWPVLEKMAGAGLTGIRINSSHSDFEFSRAVINRWRLNNPNGFIVYDIKGPKIRIGDIPEPVKVHAGQKLILRTDVPKSEDTGYPKTERLPDGIPVTFENLDEYVRVGHRLFVDDGYIGLLVKDVFKGCIVCEVMFGDIIRSRKGINHPDTRIEYPYTMPSDEVHVEFAREMGVDYVADSFTRNGEDVMELKGRLKGSSVKVISKIENPEGIKEFEGILERTDAVMIARGDLGVEIEPWKVPEMQKTMIEKCNKAGKPVITATQMLESMLENPFPSRADVSDVANAIYDGTDVVMLSGETSVGKYPVQCVEMMARIGDYVERTKRYKEKKTKWHHLSK